MSGQERPERKGVEPGVPFVVGDDAEPVAVPEPVEPVMPYVVNDTGEPVHGQPIPGEVVEVVEPEPRHGDKRDKGDQGDKRDQGDKG